jgi:hypothetical protein
VNLPATVPAAQSRRTTSVWNRATQTVSPSTASLNCSSRGLCASCAAKPTLTVRRILPVRGSAWLTVPAASSASHRLPRATAANRDPAGSPSDPATRLIRESIR